MRQIREEQYALEVIKLSKNVPKFLKEDLKAESTVILFGATAGIVKGYKNLSKQPHGKQIIKDSGVGRTRKI